MVLLTPQHTKNRRYLCACVSRFQIFSDNQLENFCIPRLYSASFPHHTQSHSQTTSLILKPYLASFPDHHQPYFQVLIQITFSIFWFRVTIWSCLWVMQDSTPLEIRYLADWHLASTTVVCCPVWSSSWMIKNVAPQILTKISAQEKFKNWLSSTEVMLPSLQAYLVWHVPNIWKLSSIYITFSNPSCCLLCGHV